MGGFNTSVAPPSPAALDIKPPVSQSPLEMAAQLQQLRGGQQEMALRQQQMQTQQLQQQEMQMNLDQRKAINDAYHDALTVNPDGTPNIDTGKLSQALATNGHGEAIPDIIKGVAAYQTSQATLKEAQQKVGVGERDAAGAAGAAVLQADGDPNLLVTLLQHAAAAHEVDPQTAAKWLLPIQQSLQQDPSGASAKVIAKQIAQQLVAQSPKQQELANQKQTAQGAQMRGQAAQEQADRAKTESDRKDAASDLATAASPDEYTAKLGALPPAIGVLFPKAGQVFDATGKATPDGLQRVRFVGMTPAEQNAAGKPAKESNPTEASLATIATDPSKTPEERAAAEAALKRLDTSKIAARPIIQTVIPGLGNQAGQGTATLTGEDYLHSLPPATANQIRAISEGRLPMPSASTRDQGAKDLRNGVMQYDPDFSEQKAQIRKAFTTGSDGRNIGNLNTAIVHLDQLGDIAKGMDNGSFQPGNDLWNRAKTMFGGAMPMNYEGLRQAVAGEMDAALHGTSTIPGREAIAATMPAKASPGQMSGIIETNLQTLGTKLNTYDQRYHQQIPGDKVWSPVLPAAQAVFQKHGLNPTAQDGAQLPQGGGKVIDPATAKQFYSAAGNDPKKARQLAVQNGWKVR